MSSSLNTENSSNNQAFCLLVFLASCTVSLFLTIHLCWHLRASGGIFTGVIAVVLGVCWESSKYMFTPFALRLIADKNGSSAHVLGGFGLLVLTLVLVMGSVLASLGFFLQSDSLSKQKGLQHSAEFKHATAKLSAINTQITLIQTAAKKYINNTYTTRGMKILKEVPTLHRERKQVEQELLALKTSSLSAGSPFFSGLASLVVSEGVPTQETIKRIKVVLYTVLAIVLELISLASLMLFCMNRGAKKDCTEFSITNCDDTRGTFTISEKYNNTNEGRGDTGTTEEGINTRYSTSKKLIVSKKISPTIRSIRRAVNVSQIIAQRFLTQLAKEGVLKRTDTGRYVLSS